MASACSQRGGRAYTDVHVYTHTHTHTLTHRRLCVSTGEDRKHYRALFLAPGEVSGEGGGGGRRRAGGGAERRENEEESERRGRAEGSRGEGGREGRREG